MSNGNFVPRIEADLRIRFEDMKVKFMEIMHEYDDEMVALCKKAIDAFDFETAFITYVHRCIDDGLEQAFQEIDLSEDFKRKIWVEIEKRLKRK